MGGAGGGLLSSSLFVSWALGSTLSEAGTGPKAGSDADKAGSALINTEKPNGGSILLPVSRPCGNWSACHREGTKHHILKGGKPLC